MMPRRPSLRHVRLSTPVKVIIALALLFLFFAPWRRAPRLTLGTDELSELWTLPREDVAARYEAARTAALQRRGYDAKAAARSVRAPRKFGDGSATFDASVDAYTTRLQEFVSRTLAASASRRSIEDSLGRLARFAPPRGAPLPRALFSTDRAGDSGVADLYRLWNALLPLPVEKELAALLPETDWAEPARKGGTWSSIIADDGQIDAQVSEWLGASVFSGDSAWAQTWEQLEFGVLRADVYRYVGTRRHNVADTRYMAMLFNGGVYADSDTAVGSCSQSSPTHANPSPSRTPTSGAWTPSASCTPTSSPSSRSSRTTRRASTRPTAASGSADCRPMTPTTLTTPTSLRSASRHHIPGCTDMSAARHSHSTAIPCRQKRRRHCCRQTSTSLCPWSSIRRSRGTGDAG